MRSRRHPGSPSRGINRAQTQDRQCDRGHCPPALYVVGIGPGSLDHLSARARQVLEQADTIVGYGTYIGLIGPLIAGKEIISTGMTKEVHRVTTAIEAAQAGQTVALVSSGDPGIYAMAGLVMEMCAARRLKVVPAGAIGFKSKDRHEGICIEVVPGIPALCAGASLLGAPLTHDFAVISLSDLLTPWEVIQRRIEAAAQADFVTVIYNPKSKKRDWQLQRAQELLLKHRSGATPVGIVTGAMRDIERIRITSLDQLYQAPIDMQTIVFVGNSSTIRYGDFLFTLRGYGRKYEFGNR
jgi:precorrin-3B C17-methyltransferase